MDNNDLKTYEYEICSLENEIKKLTEEYERRQHEAMAYSDGEIMKTVKSLKRKSPEEPKQCDSFPALKHQLDLLESDLSFIMKFTGICLTHYTRKLVEQNETKTVQKYRLSGNCQSVPFQLEFQMVEQNQNNKNISTVTGLSIIIESEGYSDLSKFVSRVEESGNLLLFFKSLSCFSEWCGHQKRTLAHFKSKYPDIVGLPEGSSGDYMILRSPALTGFELMIVWKINVDEDGTVTPVLDLLNKIPLSVMEANRFASDAPHCFRSLLYILGIQASIETLIKYFVKATE